MRRSTALKLEPLVAHSPVTAALGDLCGTASPLKKLEPFSIAPLTSATAALEELMSTSRKRARQSVEDTSDSMPSMITFDMTSTPTQPQKFDMTDLFLATESSSSDAKNMFNFPSLQWPGLLDSHDEEEEGHPSDSARQDSCSALSKDSNGRRSLSTSCLLGKRSRSGGLLRSKTLRSEVDRLVNNFANDPCQSGIIFSLGSTKA
jgi:hypothetical protein